jgi:hypothetical protein
MLMRDEPQTWNEWIANHTLPAISGWPGRKNTETSMPDVALRRDHLVRVHT